MLIHESLDEMNWRWSNIFYNVQFKAMNMYTICAKHFNI